MKTKSIISAITLVLVFAANSLFASRINDPGSSDKQKLITYEVKVNFAPNFPGANMVYLIAITDGSGRRVAPVQEFHPGVSLYIFKEAGTLKGTRVAIMVPYPTKPCGWIIAPSVKKGMFVGGATYQFELTPESNETGTKNDL